MFDLAANISLWFDAIVWLGMLFLSNCAVRGLR